MYIKYPKAWIYTFFRTSVNISVDFLQVFDFCIILLLNLIWLWWRFICKDKGFDFDCFVTEIVAFFMSRTSFCFDRVISLFWPFGKNYFIINNLLGILNWLCLMGKKGFWIDQPIPKTITEIFQFFLLEWKNPCKFR